MLKISFKIGLIPPKKSSNGTQGSATQLISLLIQPEDTL